MEPQWHWPHWYSKTTHATPSYLRPNDGMSGPLGEWTFFEHQQNTILGAERSGGPSKTRTAEEWLQCRKASIVVAWVCRCPRVPAWLLVSYEARLGGCQVQSWTKRYDKRAMCDPPLYYRRTNTAGPSFQGEDFPFFFLLLCLFFFGFCFFSGFSFLIPSHTCFHFWLPRSGVPETRPQPEAPGGGRVSRPQDPKPHVHGSPQDPKPHVHGWIPKWSQTTHVQGSQKDLTFFSFSAVESKEHQYLLESAEELSRLYFRENMTPSFTAMCFTWENGRHKRCSSRALYACLSSRAKRWQVTFVTDPSFWVAGYAEFGILPTPSNPLSHFSVSIWP